MNIGPNLRAAVEDLSEAERRAVQPWLDEVTRDAVAEKLKKAYLADVYPPSSSAKAMPTRASRWLRDAWISCVEFAEIAAIVFFGVVLVSGSVGLALAVIVGLMRAGWRLGAL